MKRRILAVLLAAIMVLSAVPFSVFAEEATVACPGKGKIHTLDNCDSEKFADVAPVCNKPGYSVYTCLNPECGDQFVVITKEASNTPHTIVKATKAATCTADGIKENVWQCTACKDYFSDAEGKNVIEDSKDYVVEKLDHKLGTDLQWETLKTDCTTQKCKLCGATRVAPTEGDHDGAHDYKVIKFHTPAATCKDTAKADVKCTVCGFEKKNVDVASDVPHDFKAAVAKQDATCTERGYKAHKQCKVCNRYFTPDGATELFANPTTNAQKTNALYIDALGHSAETYLISEKPATCTTPGSRTYRCDRAGCGEFIENEVIPANPEKGYWIYNTDTKKYKEKNGVKVIVKKTGTNTYEVWYGDKDKDYPDAEDGTLGAKQEFRDANIVLHKFSVENKPATCTEYGYTKKVCLLCGTEETVKVAPTYHLKADGKTVNGTKVADSPKAIKPTCVTAGVDIYKCNACSAEVAVKVNAWGHSAEKTVTTANCQSAGVTFTYVTAPANAPAGWTCTCDTYEAVTSPVKFYKEDGTTVKAEYALWDPATVKADADGAFIGETFFVKGGEKGITEAAKDANKHVIRTQVVNEATCTTAGNGFKFCFVKGCTFEPETYTITAKGHNFELTWANGTTAANKTLKNSQQYKTNFGTTVAATCTTNTYFAVKCTRCSAVSAAGEKVSGLSTDLANDKLGHKVVTEEFYALCDGKTLNNGLTATKGYKITYCKNEACDTKTAKDNDKQACGYVIDRVETTAYAEKLSYTKDEVENYHKDLLSSTESGVYKVGSCTEVGYDWYYCEDCDKNILVVQGDTGSHLKPETKTADNYIAYKAPTCCNPGNEEAYICQRSGCTLKDNVVGGKLEGGKLVANTIAATGAHNYVVVFNAKAPVCKTGVNGYVALYTCNASSCCKNEKFFVKIADCAEHDQKDCYHYFAAANKGNVFKEGKVDKGVVDDGKGVKILAGIKIAADHDYTNSTAKLPTCTEGGYTKKCNVCGYEFEKKDPTHTFDAKEPYAVDCLNAGYFIQTCTICDYVEITGYTAPTGHDWQPVAGKQGVKATCKEDGGDYVYCTKCSATDIKNRVEMLDHVNKDGLAIGHGDSTTPIICTINFKDDQLECKACGHKVEKTHIEKTTLIAPTCTTAGYTVVICAGCNEVLEEKTEVDTLPALNHKNGGSDAWVEIDRDPATETATGTIYYECSLCKATKTEVIPPVSTIYLDLTYANANGKEGFAEYSLITVNVLLSSKKAAIRTLSYELNYDKTKLEFVSAKFDNTFSIASINDAVVDEATGDRAVKFAGMSPNAVEVGEAAVIATITFRALAAGDAEFYFDGAEAYLEAGAKVEANVDLNEKDDTTLKGKIAIATLMDVYTKAGTIDMQDALAIYDLMTNSEYNVAADLDKDGEITANDLQLFYSIFVGKMEKAALRNYEVN